MIHYTSFDLIDIVILLPVHSTDHSIHPLIDSLFTITDHHISHYLHTLFLNIDLFDQFLFDYLFELLTIMTLCNTLINNHFKHLFIFSPIS